MNDETKQLRDELTCITSAADSRLQLGEEAELSREAWLAFGQLLATVGQNAVGPGLAGSGIDERALVRHVQLDAARRNWRRRVVTASLAASVLIVLGVVWQQLRLLERVGLPGDSGPIAGKNVPVVEPNPSTTAHRTTLLRSTEKLLVPQVSGDKLAWDDRLDRRLDRMQRQVRSIKRPRDAQPDPIAVLRNKIDVLGRDARSDRL